jgi:threonylcarbamoyladenosine tRNA methylthiotransferase MtaB
MQKGFKEIFNGKPANFYVINTCTVTHKADSGSLALIRRARRESSKAKIIVTGCLVEKDALFLSKLEKIDAIISKKFFSEGISNFCGHTRAFLKIQDGCNNFCSYCKVPFVRGKSRSRVLEDIVFEASRLVSNGFKELVLTGINLGSYGKDLEPSISLVNVIESLEGIKDLFRIRLSSIEANDVTNELICKISESKKLCRHLHIPIQSGDNQILKKMNRKYCREDYLYLIKKLKKLIPGIAITTDCLVGFPGESDKNFANTVDLIRRIKPLKVHIFPYSERPGTAAGNFNGKLKPSVIKERILKLEKICYGLAHNYIRKFLNKRMDVLVESKVKGRPGFWEGYTVNYIKVNIKSNRNLKNKLISCRL